MARFVERRRLIKEEDLSALVTARVRKLPVPLLVIGLGGTGGRIVNTIKKTFAQRFVLPVGEDGKELSAPEHTAYLVLDDYAGELWDDDELTPVHAIPLPGEVYRGYSYPSYIYGQLTDQEKEWATPPHILAETSSCLTRQAARVMFNRRYDQIIKSIKNALHKITTPQSENEKLGRIEIAICTGICGGTGSGLFLDVPQIIRHIMATDPDFAGKDYHISGYIVMPDVSLLPVAGNPVAKQLRMNGYAALKELDFWMNVGEHQTPYTMEYGTHTRIDWKHPPYDDCYLLSGEKVDGTVIPNAGEVIRKTVAEHLVNFYADNTFCAHGGYAYKAHEADRRHAYCMASKPYPVFYGYRALGTYSVRIPRKKMLYFEGMLLFDTFLPLRNEAGQFCASDRLIEDGQTVARAQAIIGVVKDLHANFARELNLPGFCNVTADDRPRIEVMRQMQPHPHDRENIKPNPWVDSIAKPCAGKAAEFYLAVAWRRFEDFCASVMSKPELGPFDLRDYLDHPDKGLLKEMEAQVGTWLNLARKFKIDLLALKQSCMDSWPAFEHPSLLLWYAHQVEPYLQNLNNYYAGLRKAVFMEAHARAAQKLLLRMREYLTNSLKPLCSDIEQLYDMIKDLPDDDPALGSDVLDFEILKPRIMEQFYYGNENYRIAQTFLRELCNISLQTEPNKDTDASGVTFVYRQEGHKALLSAMQETLNMCFYSINYLSMDQLMVQAVGEGSVAQQAFMKENADALLAGAQPLFARNPSVPLTNMAPESFISVPANAPEWNHYFSADRSMNAFVNESYRYDQINCITTWNSLPMSSYRLMPELRRDYANGLRHPMVSMGVHLVWNGDPNAEYPNNWRKLPDPRPFYFFAAKGDPAEEAAWHEARALTERAIKSGMMEVDSSNRCPIFRLHVFWQDENHREEVSAHEISDHVKVIENQKMDPNTDEPLTPEQTLGMLKAYEAQADVTIFEPGMPSGCMARYMELEGEDINPWNNAVANDPIRKKRALFYHRYMSEMLAAAILMQHPRLLLIVKSQIEGYEAIARAKDDIEPLVKTWTPRIAYAETYAKMIFHNLLKYSPVGAYVFDEQGNPTPVIQDFLMKADLKNQPVFTKVGAYLADLPEDDPVRTLLERQAKEKEEEYDQKALNGLLTMEDCASGIAVCERMKSLIDNELRQKKAGLNQLGTDADTLNKCIKLLDTVAAFLDVRRGQLDWTRAMLDH